MKKQVFLVVATAVCVIFNVAYADTAPFIGTSPSTDRADFGWGSKNGSNIEMYQKNHATKPGASRFIYGGGGTTGLEGQIAFVQYDSIKDQFLNRVIVDKNGNVGIGTITPCPLCKLAVNGRLRAKEIIVDSGWADYVFAENYTLRPLEEVASYIAANHSLPGMPSEVSVKSEGVDLAQFNVKLLEKVEELTLYMIDLKKENAALKQQVAQLKQTVEASP